MDSEMRIRIVEEIEAALGGGPQVVTATVTDGGEPTSAEPGEKLLVRRDGEVLGTLGDGALDAAVVQAAREVFTAFPRIAVQTLYCSRDGRATTRRSEAHEGDAQVMLQLFEAPARLVIVGAGHVGLATAQLAEMLGYAVTVVDDREEFANRERFPMAEAILTGDGAAALDALDLDANTSVVLVSRGHRQDEEALRHVVGRGAGYVGMIGSRRRTATVLRHLLGEGLDRDALEVVSTPIGLDI